MKKKELGYKYSKNDLHSINDESFYTKKQNSISSINWPETGLVDHLIDYLTEHLTVLGNRDERLNKFETQVADVLNKCSEPDLHRIFKEQGWTGSHFQLSIEPPFIDAQSCLNALSNYYLKINSQPALVDLTAADTFESHQLDQILPFCPDVVVTYLKRQPITSSSSGPRRLTFKGACMLADISGFSKFSGAMCSKGVSGLDDLREATNGFLGYFVKQVYEYEGDVICFAGDALICAFRDSSEGTGESCFRALQCAHVLRQHKTASLSTHIGVTCGEMQIGLLGGHNDQWCYVMNGDCVSQLASCIEDAGSQEVAITAECYEYALERDSNPGTPAAQRNHLVVEDVRKPSGNYLLKNIGVRRTSVVPPPLSPFTHSSGDHPHHGNAWGALKHQYNHVHDVAAVVLTRQRSDHLIDEGMRKAALLSLARTSSELSGASTVPVHRPLPQLPTPPSGSPSTTCEVLMPPPIPAHDGIRSHLSVSAHDEIGSHLSAITEASAEGTPASVVLQLSPSKPLGRKRSAIMEKYVSPVDSLVSSPNTSSKCSNHTSARNMLSSPAMKGKLAMRSPVFTNRNFSSFTLDTLSADSAQSPVKVSPEEAAAGRDALDKLLGLPSPSSAPTDLQEHVPDTELSHLQRQNGHSVMHADEPTPEPQKTPPLVPSRLGFAGVNLEKLRHLSGSSLPHPPAPAMSQLETQDAGSPSALPPLETHDATSPPALPPLHTPNSQGFSVTGSSTSTQQPAPSIADTPHRRPPSAPRANSTGVIDAVEPPQLQSALKRGSSYRTDHHDESHSAGVIDIAHISMAKHGSLRSVNFSRGTSYSDITAETGARESNSISPVSMANLDAALRIARGDSTSISGPLDHSHVSSNSVSGRPYGAFSAQNSVELNKKRFAGWNVMKSALRRESFREKYKTTESTFIRSVSKFVPRPVLNAVHSECLDLIGELRQVTTMFVALNSYSDVTNRDPCTLQPFFLMAQTILHESGGFLRQFLVDDKGCVFIAMWGVPSFTYSNNCSRALYCAARIVEGSKALDHAVSIGIATGTVFCGSVGALERRDYAGVGTDVNMAARLMSKAHGRILLDPATYRSLSKDTQQLLIQAEEMHLKGMAGPTAPYQYASNTLPCITDIDVESAKQSVLRPKTQAVLNKLLDSFLNVSPEVDTLELLEKKLAVTFNFLFGLPGTGKSLAAQFYRNTARLRNINCLHLVAKADTKGVPYGLLRELFLELIGRNNFATFEQRMQVVTRIIDEICDETDSEEDRTAALESLQLVLGIDAGDLEEMRVSIFQRANSTVEGESPSQRSLGQHQSSDTPTLRSRSSHLTLRHSSSQSRKLDDYTFYNVFAHLLHNTPTVLIIENAQHVDELSWKELFLIQAGDQLDISVLLTMEVAHIPEGRYKVADQEALHAAKASGAQANQSFKGDYWDAKEGPEAAEHSEAVEKYNASHDSDDAIPVDFAHINLTPACSRGLSSPNASMNKMSARSTMSMDEDIQNVTPRNHLGDFWCSILDNATTTVLVLGELSRDEVKHEMTRFIDTTALTDGLVDLVYNITSGNAYWVKAMAQFIRERGADTIFAAVSDRRSRQNPLKQLVLVHFETHLPEYQMLSKHASIIGVEFDEEMLKAIIPKKLQSSLTASLDQLVEKRFLQCLDPQDRTFCFPNQLIQTTIYELTPPSDAAHLHLQIAQYLEKTFEHDLRSHYPTLGFHYKRCPDKRELAFKYEIKAADQQVAKGAYSDGLAFLKSAAKLAEREVELDLVLEVIDRAVADIKEHMSTAHSPRTVTTALQRLHSFYTGSHNSRTNGFVLRYNALKKFVLTKNEKGKKERIENDKIESEKSSEKKKELLERARKEGKEGMLTWQPSYVARRRDSSSTSYNDTTTSKLSRNSLSGSFKSEHSSSCLTAADNTTTTAVHDAGCQCTIS